MLDSSKDKTLAMETEYANISSRTKAVIIDTVVIVAMMYAATEILELFESVPNYVRVGIALFIFVLYEPIFVSSFGQTIGHSRSNLIVRRVENEDQYISFINALIRFALKVLLDWLSLLTVTGSEKNKQFTIRLLNRLLLKKLNNFLYINSFG